MTQHQSNLRRSIYVQKHLSDHHSREDPAIDGKLSVRLNYPCIGPYCLAQNGKELRKCQINSTFLQVDLFPYFPQSQSLLRSHRSLSYPGFIHKQLLHASCIITTTGNRRGTQMAEGSIAINSCSDRMVKQYVEAQRIVMEQNVHEYIMPICLQCDFISTRSTVQPPISLPPLINPSLYICQYEIHSCSLRNSELYRALFDSFSNT